MIPKRAIFLLLLVPLWLLAACNANQPAGLPSDINVDELTGMAVRDESSQIIGTATEVILNTGSDSIDYVAVRLVQRPFTSGHGEQWTEIHDLVPIPWRLFTIDETRNDLVLHTSPANIANAPAYDKLPVSLEPGWDGEVSAFWATIP